MIVLPILLLGFALPAAAAQVPVIDAAPTRLIFIVGQDRTVPLPQRVRIGNAGAGDLAWRAIPSAPWVRVSPASGSAPADLTIAADPARLSTGEHRGRVTISRDGGGADPVVVDVLLQIVEVKPPPDAPAPPAPALDLTATEGATEPLISTVTLNGPGDAVVAWHAETDQPWVTVDPAEGTTPSRISVSVSPRSLGRGSHQATIRLVEAGGEALLTVPVALVVGGDAGPLSVAAELPAAVRNLPYSQAVPIRGGKPPYSVRLVQGRLPLGFAIAGGAVSGTSGQAGSYTFIVAVSDSATPPATIVQPVSLRVNLLLQSTALRVAPASLEIVATSGRAVSAQVSVSSGAQALAWRAASDVPWLTVAPAGGLGAALVRVAANPSGLAPGVYVATLTITMDGAPNGTARIPVQLTVRQ